MFFGGNKNINKKLGAFVIALAFVFGLFYFFGFANAQSDDIRVDAFFGLPDGQKLIELEACAGSGGGYEDKSDCRMSENVYNAVIDTDIVGDIINEDISIEDIPTEEQNNNLLTTNFQDLPLERKLTEVDACTGSGGGYEDKSDCRMSENVYNATKQLAENELEKDENKRAIKCSLTNPGGCIEKWFLDGVGKISNIIIQFVGILLRLAGTVLDQTVSITIIGMSDLLKENGDAIKDAWSIIRDIINMTFIFGLLFISLTTIIKGIGPKTKNLLITIIASALLINFSYFFTAVLIDGSNFLSIEILNNVKKCGLESANEKDNVVGQILNNFDGGISSCVMNEIEIQSAFNPESEEGFANQVNPTDGLGGNIFKIFLSTIFGAFFIIITSFVFFALAIMLIIRFVLIIILLITSPIMFLGWVLPNLSGISKKWFKSLNEQLLFPPLVFLFIYITIEIAGTINLIGTTTMGIVINYLIIMSFMIGSILIAKKVGGVGGGVATKLAGKASIGFASRSAGSLGRRTIGRGAAAVSDKITGSTRTSQFFKKKIDGVANSSFDARNTKSFQGIASATGLTGATGTPTTKGFRGRQEEKADLEKERYDNAKKQTASEAKQIESQLRDIETKEEKWAKDNDTKSRLTVIKDSKKELETDRQELSYVNNQMRGLDKGSKEYSDLKIKSQAISKKMRETKGKVDEAKQELEKQYEGELKDIKKIKKAGKKRGENYMKIAQKRADRSEKWYGSGKIAGSSASLAARKISDSARNKEGEKGELTKIVDDYDKDKAGKDRYAEYEAEARNEAARKNKPEGGVDDDFYENGGTTGI